MVNYEFLNMKAENEADSASVLFVDAIIDKFESITEKEGYSLYDIADDFYYGKWRDESFRLFKYNKYWHSNFLLDYYDFGLVLSVNLPGYGNKGCVAVYNKNTGEFHRLGLAALVDAGIGRVVSNSYSFMGVGVKDKDKWLKFCEKCGAMCQLNETSKGYVCDMCARDYVVCDYCGKLEAETNAREVYVNDSDVEIWCELCANSNSTYCEYHERDESDEFFESYYVTGYGSVCEDGFNELDAQLCSTCDEYCLPDDGMVCSDGEWRCNSCASEYEDEHGAVHDYYYKPSPSFVEKDGARSSIESVGALYLGIELETDNGDGREFAREIENEFGEYIYCKEDGSLCELGVELVTHPLHESFAYDWDAWDKIRRLALDNGMRSHDAESSCGLHMHINRSFFGEGIAQDYNLAKLLYIFEHYFDELVKFSRRKRSQLEWCRETDEDFNEHDDDDVICCKINSASRDRYQAVNLRNSSTVEIRLWRGTLKVSTIKVTIDFTQALARYVVANDFTDIMRVASFSELMDKVGEYAHDANAMRAYADSRECFNA